MPQETSVTHRTSTHLSGFLASNAAPDALEAASIRRGSIAIQDQISQLRAQLCHLEGLLQDHRRVLSAVRRTPAEVWGRILTFVLPLHAEEFKKQELLKLALICKAWHQAALATHQLWSHYVADAYPPSFEAAQSWLRRSGTLQPKSLKVVCNHAHGAEDKCTVMHSEVVRVLEEGPKLNHLLLRCQNLLCLRRLCERIRPSQWGPIEILNLHFKSRTYNQPTGMDPIEIPPNVTSLVVDLGYESRLYHLQHPIRLSQSVMERLTSFSFNSRMWTTGGQFLQALHHLANLERLTIGSIRKEWLYPDGVATTVSLPHLHTLHLLQVQETTLLESLMLPALRELVVRGEDLDKDPFRSLTRNPDSQFSLPHPELRCPNLRVLRLYSLPVSPRELASTLRHLPHLVELTLGRVVSDSVQLSETFEPANCSCFDMGSPCICGPRKTGKYSKPNSVRDVFQTLQCCDIESRSLEGRINLPSLQILEILDLPVAYNLTNIRSYLRGRLIGPQPAHANEDTLKRLIVTFQPSPIPENFRIENFENVRDELEKIGIWTSITPPRLYPSKQPLYNMP